jgi:hypothetical protein
VTDYRQQHWRLALHISRSAGAASLLGKVTFFLAATVAVAVVAHYCSFMIKTSLWKDEIYTIRHFSSQGAYRAWTDYHVPNNHILFNIINSAWPVSAAYTPINARLLSFVAVFGGIALVGWQALRERAWAAGGIGLLLLATNVPSLDGTLQARGYGLVFAAAVLQTIAVREYFLSARRAWLVALGCASFVGGATIPIFVFLAAPTMIGVLIVRRRREVLLAALVTAAAGLAFYYPTAFQILDAASTYAEKWGAQYTSISAVYETMKYYFPAGLFGAAYLVLFVLVLARGLFVGERSRREFLVVVLAALAAFFLACLVMKTPLIRTTQFVAGVLAVLFVVAAGKIKGAPRREWPAEQMILTVAVVPLLIIGGKQLANDRFTPIEAWLETARAVELVSPDESTVFAPFRGWQLSVYLGNPKRIVPAFDREQFVSGYQTVVDSNFRRKEKFIGADYSPSAVDIRVPQRRGGFQMISFVPRPTSGLSDVRLDGTRPDDLSLMMDGQTATRWSAGESQSKLKKPVTLEFSIDQDKGCDRLFLFAADGDLPQRFAIAAIKDGQTRKLDKDAIRRIDDLLILDLAGIGPERVVLKAKLSRTNFLSINEAWCENRAPDAATADAK